MKQSGRKIHSIALLTFAVLLQTMQSQTVWSDVQLNTNEVYVGEPVEVTLSVYTSTWFTKGIDPGNIKVNGAFTVYFRPVSSSVTQNGKTYAGVKLIYHVFPFDEKNLQFPELNIEVETPPDGGYEGKKKTVKTKPKTIKVKPVPPGFNRNSWLVADGLTVQDQWNSNLQQAKIGDVLSRSIRIQVDGTVSELIPPITWDSIPGVSQYPARSTVDNQKSKTTISAYRQETMRFLLEDTGKVVFPEMVIRWYNPLQQKMYKRTLKAVSVNVLPNPDLGLLSSIRDSLQVVSANETTETAAQQITIFGLPLSTFAGVVIAFLLLLWGCIKFIPKMVQNLKQRHAAYVQSEPYYFQQFVKSVQRKDHKNAINAMYCWVDRLHLEQPTAQFFAKKFGNKKLQNVVSNIENLKVSKDWSLKSWKTARENFLRHGVSKINDIRWINP